MDERTNILEAIRHSSFDQLMAAGEKWCPQTLGDVLTALLTDSPDTAAVRQQAARVAKVQLREPDTRSRRETGALGARPTSPDGAQDAEANNELAVTQRSGAEFNELASEVKFVDVDVVADITI